MTFNFDLDEDIYKKFALAVQLSNEDKTKYWKGFYLSMQAAHLRKRQNHLE
jgi:hypothetical protein